MNNGELQLVNGGSEIFWKPIKKDKRFSGYRVLGKSERIVNNDFDQIQLHVAEHVYLALNDKYTSLCSGEEAIMTQRILEKIKLNYE